MEDGWDRWKNSWWGAAPAPAAEEGAYASVPDRPDGPAAPGGTAARRGAGPPRTVSQAARDRRGRGDPSPRQNGDRQPARGNRLAAGRGGPPSRASRRAGGPARP